VFETIGNHSPNNFHELKIYNYSDSEVFSEDLESFFINWKNRTPKKQLSLMTFIDLHRRLDSYEENMKIIDKYESLNIIKFRTKRYKDEEREEEI
jgi:hypothetical protein